MADDFRPESIVWVLNDDSMSALSDAISTCIEAVVDLETTGLDPWAAGEPHKNGGVPARIVLASFTLPQEDDPVPVLPTTWVVPLSHPESPWLGSWRQVMHRLALKIRTNDVPLVNQNVKFDCRWIYAQTGVDLSPCIVWDTQVSSHLLDENASTKLKERAPATFEVDRWDDVDLTYPGAAEEVPLFDLGIYAARDTYWTWRLAQLHREQMFLSEETMGHEPSTADEVEMVRLGRLAVWCSMPTVSTLTSIEQTGLTLDEAWTREELDAHLVQGHALSSELGSLYVLPGREEQDPSWAPTSHWFRDWTDAAVQAGDLRVAELTPTGKPRWSKNVLRRQARNGSTVAAQLLDLRSHYKKAEFLNAWLEYMTTGDHEIHASYNVGSVLTGRLSSSGPNMQQVTAALKPAFIPRPGYLFADLDYSQIELRVAAHISGCVPMIEAFRRGDDLHTLLAAKITGKPADAVTKEERQAGKSANFGLLYMMGAYGFREYAEDVYGVVFTLEEAAAIHRAFFEMWDGMGEWHLRAIKRARDTGQVISPIGRIRRVPGIFNDETGMYERAAVNSPVQGFASDLMQMAAASIAGRLPGVQAVHNAILVATVHDSILIEVPADDWERITRECIDRMLNLDDVLTRLDCTLSVPLAVEAKVGTRWGMADVGEMSG